MSAYEDASSDAGQRMAKTYKAVLLAERNLSDGAGDLAGDKGTASSGRFMVEKDPVRSVHAV